MINFESISNKLDEFRIRVNNCNPYVIFGTETWLKAETENGFIDIPGFKNFRTDTVEVRGGVIIYVREELTVEECDILNQIYVKDTLWLKLKCDGSPDSILGVVYRKGDASLEHNNNLLQMIDRALSLCNGRLLLCGDFNLPRVDWANNFVNDTENSISQLFLDRFNDLYLCQHVSEPTRQRGTDTPHCLDLVLTSNEVNVSNVEVDSPLGRADHSVVTWNFLVKRERVCDKDVYKYDYRKADYNLLRQLMMEVDWSPVTEANNVCNAWDYFQEKLASAVDQCVPKVKVTNGGKLNPPWFNVTNGRLEESTCTLPGKGILRLDLIQGLLNIVKLEIKCQKSLDRLKKCFSKTDYMQV